MTKTANSMLPRNDDADERWFAALIKARAQLAPGARRRFDDEHADAVSARRREFLAGR